MRLTECTESGYRLACTEADAAEKLGRLEDLVRRLPAQQQKIHEKMEALRSQGKEKAVNFEN